jgi:predicted permease
LLLLIGAGLFVKSLSNLRALGPGFPAERLIGFQLDPTMNGYTSERARLFYRNLTESLGTLPGVQSVGLAGVRILEDNEWDNSALVEGYTSPRAGDHPEPFMNNISPGYFATMGVPIVHGRDFTEKDTEHVLHSKGRPPRNEDYYTPSTIIINETFAKKYFAGRSPLGRHIGMGIDPGTKLDMEIIGVVKDFKYTNLRDDIPEQAFEPYLAEDHTFGMTVYLRTTMDPNQLFSAVRAKVRELDSNVPIYGMRTTDEQISNSLSTERLIASLSAVFGFLATLLATIGLYGVMAYTVARRTREIGIRMALGADWKNVVRMIGKQAAIMGLAGIGAGLILCLAAEKVLTASLKLPAFDPVLFVLVQVGLLLTTVLAAAIPARKAARIDPMRALRQD